MCSPGGVTSWKTCPHSMHMAGFSLFTTCHKTSCCFVKLLPEKKSEKITKPPYPCNQQYELGTRSQRVQVRQAFPYGQRECGSLPKRRSLLGILGHASFVVWSIFQDAQHLCLLQGQQFLNNRLISTRDTMHTEEVVEASIQFAKILRERLLRRVNRRALVFVLISNANRSGLQIATTNPGRGLIAATDYGRSTSRNNTTDREARSEGQGHRVFSECKKIISERGIIRTQMKQSGRKRKYDTVDKASQSNRIGSLVTEFSL